MNIIGSPRGTRVVWKSSDKHIIKAGTLVRVSGETETLPGVIWDDDPTYIIMAKPSNQWWRNVEPFPTAEEVEELKRRLRALGHERDALLAQLQAVTKDEPQG